MSENEPLQLKMSHSLERKPEEESDSSKNPEYHWDSARIYNENRKNELRELAGENLSGLDSCPLSIKEEYLKLVAGLNPYEVDGIIDQVKRMESVGKTWRFRQEHIDAIIGGRKYVEEWTWISNAIFNFLVNSKIPKNQEEFEKFNQQTTEIEKRYNELGSLDVFEAQVQYALNKKDFDEFINSKNNRILLSNQLKRLPWSEKK